MGRRKVKWVSGDVFLVPLEDGSFGHGQVLSYEGQALNSAVCAFSSMHFPQSMDNPEPVSEANLIALLFVTRDLLDSGRWVIKNNQPNIQWEIRIDIEARRAKGFIGTTIHGSRSVANFLSAYHKLFPWNFYRDPHELDKMLISPDKKPASVIIKQKDVEP